MREIRRVRELIGEIAVGGVVPVLRRGLAVQHEVLGLPPDVAQPPEEQRKLFAVAFATGGAGGAGG